MPPPEAPFLAPAGPDAKLLAEIENLQLAARNVAQGALAGVHRSLRRGTSIEFKEHKVYSFGDEIRHIDWRAFAKSDRYHVKQFEDETNLRLELLVDHSGSMGFASPGRPSKLQYARVLAGALSYLALRQGDATGLHTFAQSPDDPLPARATSGHLMEILSRLANLAPLGATSVGRCIDQFAQTRGKRSVAVVFSDLFDPDPRMLEAFARLAARRHDVAVFHVLDPAEVDFDFDAPAFFASMEDQRRVFTHPRSLRPVFVREMAKFLRTTAHALAERGVLYMPVRTHEEPAQIIGRFIRHQATGTSPKL